MSETRYVRLTTRPGVNPTGQVLRVPRRIAEAWVADGVAEYAVDPTKQETAMLAAIGETAMLPKGRGRRVRRG